MKLQVKTKDNYFIQVDDSIIDRSGFLKASLHFKQKEYIYLQFNKADLVLLFDVLKNNYNISFDESIILSPIISYLDIDFDIDFEEILKTSKLKKLRSLKDRFPEYNLTGLQQILDDLWIDTIEDNNLEEKKKLLKLGVNPNLKEKRWSKGSALFYAAENGFKNIVQLLLKYNANVEIEDRTGKTPIMRAISKAHKDIIYMLIKAGADINHIDGCKETGAFTISMKGNVEIMNILIEEGTPLDILNLPNTVNDETPLLIAIRFHRKEMVDLLIKIGVDLEHKNYGTSAIWKAYNKSNYDIFELLVNAGADVNSTNENRNGKTLLTQIRHDNRYGSDKWIDLLIKAGAK